MTNRLAEIQAQNVRAIMQRDDLTFKALSELVGVGYGALINSFREDNPRNAPSKKTMKAIEEAYQLPHGTLNKVDGHNAPRETPSSDEDEPKPAKDHEFPPTVIDTVHILMRVGDNEVALRVSKEMSQRILNMVLFNEG